MFLFWIEYWIFSFCLTSTSRSGNLRQTNWHSQTLWKWRCLLFLALHTWSLVLSLVSSITCELFLLPIIIENKDKSKIYDALSVNITRIWHWNKEFLIQLDVMLLTLNNYTGKFSNIYIDVVHFNFSLI